MIILSLIGDNMMKERILRLFYKNLGGEFTIHEISKLTKISYSYVHGQIGLLVKNGILAINNRSGRKYCRPIYGSPEVKAIFVKISIDEKEILLKNEYKLRQIVNELFLRLPEKLEYNLLSAALFGSFVKGKAQKKSDMDLFLLVPSKEKYDEIVENECVSVSRRYGVQINPLVSEPISFINMLRSEEINVAKEIMANKIILFGPEKFWELVFEVLK